MDQAQHMGKIAIYFWIVIMLVTMVQAGTGGMPDNPGSLPTEEILELESTLYDAHPETNQMDMIVTEEQIREFFTPTKDGDHSGMRNGIRNKKYRWPQGRVFIDIDPSFSPAQRKVILSAVKHIEDKTCIRFYYRDRSTRDYVYITRGGGCSSYIGRLGGRQTLILGRGCVWKPTVAHELVHAIGFWHEQSRSDRDQWVKINWRNIPRALRYNFEKLNANSVENYGEAYDYKSLMHYGGYDFGINPNFPTIYPKRSTLHPRKLGNSEGLTPADVRKINRMYKGIC